MSHPADDEINKERVRRHTEILAGAARLEFRAYQLIIEAHELRKLADKLTATIEKESSK
jgi:hypothetical protein